MDLSVPQWSPKAPNILLRECTLCVFHISVVILVKSFTSAYFLCLNLTSPACLHKTHMHSVLFFSWCWFDCWHCWFCVCLLFSGFFSPQYCIVKEAFYLPASVVWVHGRVCAGLCKSFSEYVCVNAIACVCTLASWRVCVSWNARWGYMELNPLRCRSCCSVAVCVQRPVTHSEHPWTWMWLHVSPCWAAVSTNTCFVLKSVGFWTVCGAAHLFQIIKILYDYVKYIIW